MFKSDTSLENSFKWSTKSTCLEDNDKKISKYAC